MIVFSERHLRRLLKSFLDDCYHPARCHQSLAGNSPCPWSVEAPALGQVVSVPTVGGLHHVYRHVG